MKSAHQAYKGARDFYPTDYRLQAYIFKKWIETVELYGYERYEASVVEYLNLYQVKGQANAEILNEQIYSFTDRAQRQLALRPEMTPSLARLVAAQQQTLSYPLRWYSLPNVWRYERPQRGRLREHWQLNVDLLGLNDHNAELELIGLASDILTNFGAKPAMYTIRLGSRAVLEAIFRQWLKLEETQFKQLIQLFDRYYKMEPQAFKGACQQILANDQVLVESVLDKLGILVDLKNLADLPTEIRDSQAGRQLQTLLDDLSATEVPNAVLDLTIVRGFDYYTGVVFEIFDNHPDNKRSLFGGGRYDNLLANFGGQALAGVGFGLGDVTMADFFKQPPAFTES